MADTPPPNSAPPPEKSTPPPTHEPGEVRIGAPVRLRDATSRPPSVADHLTPAQQASMAIRRGALRALRRVQALDDVAARLDELEQAADRRERDRRLARLRRR